MPFAGGLREALERGGLVGKLGEDLVQLRDFQNLLHLRGQAHHLHRPALLNDSEVVAHQFADSGAVQVNQATQIQNNVGFAMLEES